MCNTSQQIVHYDGVIRRIVDSNPTRSVQLLMQEYTLASDRDAFVAALVGRLAIAQFRKSIQEGGAV